ncbi:hypothetical protein K456DRAFT_1726966 [Colletotrichum gloeosporioides 23]|nr:hypothetical protein K456DRAFT_1726966 [Colletotrichum gloeosporioides 23]
MAEVLGVVAASIQLAELATKAMLGTIKLVREVQDGPAKLASQLEDVERSTDRVNYFCGHIIGAGSATVDHIEPGLMARLAASCDGSRQAANDAQNLLRPLVESLDLVKHKPALRAWKTLSSKTRESAILEKLRRLDKANLELVGDFNIAIFKVQIAARKICSER